jgi:hypothetical protein
VIVTYEDPTLVSTLANSSVDNSPFKFNQLVISQQTGTGNSDLIDNWTQIIAGAELTTGATTLLGTVGTNSITFGSGGTIPSTNSGDFGYIDDAPSATSSKDYTLKIWLVNPLSDALAAQVDNLVLGFAVTPGGFTLNNTSNNQLSSSFIGTQSTLNSSNAIDVDATILLFDAPGTSTTPTDPQIVSGSIGVNTPFSASSEQDPTVYALDANNNLDLDYEAPTNTPTITNTLSLGQITGSPSFSNGVLSLNNYRFTTAGTNTQIVVAGNGLPAVTSAMSSQVDAVITSTTTISDATTPATELASFTSLTTAVPASHNFDFTVTDDAVASVTTYADNDGLPTLIQTVTITQDANNGINGGGDVGTFDDWTLSIAGAQLTDGTSSVTITNPSANITGSTLTFNVAGTSMETVADGGNKTYQLRIWLRNPVDASLQDILDNKDFAFAINQGNVSVGAANTTSTLTASSTNTGDGRNVVTVTATQLDFITQWTVNASQNYDAPLSPSPTAKARDANQNLDINYNTAASLNGFAFDTDGLGPKTYPLDNSAVTVLNGLITFDPGLGVNSLGLGTNGDISRLVLTSGALTTGNSNNFTLNYSGASDIARENTDFVYPTNILYAAAANQVADIGAATGVAMERFRIRDGGGSVDTDGTATKMASVTIRVTNYQYLRRIALYEDGTSPGYALNNEIAELDASAATNIVGNTADFVFSGITTFEATDGGTRENNFLVKVSFVSTQFTGVNNIDNKVLTFEVVAVAAGGVSSSFATATPTGTASSVTVDQNKLEVVADRLDITTPAAASFVSLNANFSPVVEARDVYVNLDLDFTGGAGNITALTNAAGSTMTSSPAVVGSNFTSGIYTFPADFKFTTGNNNADVTLTMTASGVSTSPSGISPALTLKTSTLEPGVLSEPLEIESYRTTAATALSVFDFVVDDDDQQPSNTDALPTQISQIVITQLAGENEIANWTELIAPGGATLVDNQGNSISGSVNATDITFSGIPNGVNQLGHIADNGTKTYTLRIYLRSSLGGTLPADVDNDFIAFEVLQANVTTLAATTTSSTFGNSENENSGTTTNKIDVDITQLVFTTNLIGDAVHGDLLTDKDINTQQAVPVVKAWDNQSNTDLDFNETLNIYSDYGITYNTASLTPDNAVPNAGVYTFPNGFRYTNSGEGELWLESNINGHYVYSNTINVRGGMAAIVSGGTGNTTPVSSLTNLTPLSNELTTLTPGTNVFDFTIEDDPGSTPANENDGSPLRLTQIVIAAGSGNTIAQWNEAISGATLTDNEGSPNVMAVTSIGTNTLTFSGIVNTADALGEIEDGTTKDYTLKIWLRDTLDGTQNYHSSIDGLNFAFEVRSVDQVPIATGAGASSTFRSTLSTPPSTTSTTGQSDNEVQVIATKIDFTSVAVGQQASISVDISPNVVAEARDANGNRDLSYAGAITFTNPISGNGNTSDFLTGNLPSSAFNNGVLPYPSNFQFLAGNGTTRLTIEGGASGGAGALTGLSRVINVISSFESVLVSQRDLLNSTAPHSINYINYQAPDIQATSVTTTNGFVLDTLYLADGGFDVTDLDGAPTVLDDLTLGISNPQSIQKIAIYTQNPATGAVAEIQELSNSSIVVANGYGQVPFTNLNITVADAGPTPPSNTGFVQLLVVATFEDNASKITDRDDIQTAVLAATLNTGSRFAPDAAETGTIGGMPTSTFTLPEATSSATVGTIGFINDIQVTATSLDFVTQPSDYAGRQEPITGFTTDPNGVLNTSPGGSTGIVHARDKFEVIDTDFTGATYPVTITAPANPVNYPIAFTNGILDLTGMRYSSAGDGTLSVQANGIDSSFPAVNTTGTITVTATSTAVTGSGTQFTTDLAIGSRISNAAGVYIGTVASIASNTSLTLNAPGAAVAVTAGSYVAGSVPSELVDVIHVTVNNADNTGAVELTPSLKGGTTGHRIFGFEFEAQHYTTTPLSEPTLTSFAIVFKNNNGGAYPYTTASGFTIFKNFKLHKDGGSGVQPLTEGIHYSLTQTRSAALDSAFAPNPVPTGTYDKLVFNLLTASPINGRAELFLNNGKIRYYLTVDVDVDANVSTPPITPILVDRGYNTSTNAHMVTSRGSSKALVAGITRQFASTKPPLLASSYPATGQLNVNPGLDSVVLYFDVPVVTFDGKIELYHRDTDTLVAVLQATNAFYDENLLDGLNQPVPIQDQTADSLVFAMPSGVTLVNDEVYYIKIAKGRFSNTDVTDRSGISDEGFNLFGGISYNGSLYFKAASNNPPDLRGTIPDTYLYTPTSASFNLEFDKTGKLYYMVVHPTGAPTTVTNDQIRGKALYTASAIIARDSVIITQVSDNSQWITVNAQLAAATNYPVYVYAQNDAEPNPIVAAAPYGSAANGFDIGLPGPTTTLTLTNPSVISKTQYEICANSSTRLEAPMVISEPAAAPGAFALGGYGATEQKFNILLPTGFQFDVTKTPTITLSSGVDFAVLQPNPNYRFVNTTLLEVSFINSGNSSTDNIVISDLFVTASSSSVSGSIVRFYGDGLNMVSTGTELAFISATTAATIPFDNSYNVVNQFSSIYSQIAPGTVVSYIPDSYIENGTDVVRLIPLPTVANDYGASFFVGSGVTEDELTLSAVELNAAFNISLTHTDQKGCNSSTIEQYLVYDHTDAIPQLLNAKNDVRIGISNPNYPALPPPSVSTGLVSYVGLAGYKLIDLYADIPKRAQGSRQVLDYDSTGWQSLVKNIPIHVSGNTHYDANLNQNFKDYRWDYSGLINKDSAAFYNVPYVYDTTASVGFSSKTPQSRIYFDARSLGKIEYTGIYQSTADFGLFVPFRQEVELYIPAIPVVEVEERAVSGYDPADPLKPSVTSWPLGTPIFCQNGDPITVNGYPGATASVSLGYFDIVDAANPTDTLYSHYDPPGPTQRINFGGFVDNQNGSAIISPNALKNSAGLVANGYKDIRIIYTYRQVASPIKGSSDLVIRISPNPIASFIAESDLSQANPLVDGKPVTINAYCEDNLIRFTNTSTFPVGASGYFPLTNAKWNLGDDSQPVDINEPTDSISVAIRYSNSGRVPVTFEVSSQYNCRSQVFTDDLFIGAIPNTSFTMVGISTNTPVQVTSTSTVADATGVNSEVLLMDWIYSPSTTRTALTSNPYTTPGQYAITHIATTNITSADGVLPGCERSLTKDVIIVPYIDAATTGNVISENFEIPTALGAQWQPYSFAPSPPSSWQIGPVTKANLGVLPTNVWATGSATPYLANEDSYLYTPSYNITGMARPMVSFDYVTFMTTNDGVVFEFSVDTLNAADPAKKWYRIGTDQDGNNWYNGLALASSPGDQLKYGEITSSNDNGWSGIIAPDPADGKPKNAQHTISYDIPSGSVTRSHVQFRFAFASTSASSEGFAFDNFRIGERTRIILVENFTNAGSSDKRIKTESDYLINDLGTINDGVAALVPGVDYVRMVYHVGFPEKDPFNLDNPDDPSARALFYNVTSTPNARMDGLTSTGLNVGTTNFISDWGTKGFDRRTLELAKAKIDFVQAVSTGGDYKVQVTVTATSQLDPSTILNIALAEQQVPKASLSATQQALINSGEDQFEYVVKKLLPTASGIKLTTGLNQNGTFTTGELTWSPDSKWLYAPVHNIVAIAFLQDETTKEVHQVAMSAPINDPATITGLENPFNFNDIAIYPNPADQQLNIVFPNRIEVDIPIMMFDQMGRATHSVKAKKGEQSATLETGNVASGVYILQLDLGGGKISRTKVIIGHKE